MKGRICNVFVKTVILALLVLVVLGLWYIGNKVFNVASSSVQFGTIMDTVIALSNAIMAYVAVYAAYSARKWFEQKKKETTSQKVENLIYTGNALVSILNAINSNIENKHEKNLNEKPQLLIKTYTEFKSAKICLLLWGRDIVDQDFINKTDEIIIKSFNVYQSINSPDKRKQQMDVPTVKDPIIEIRNVFEEIQNKTMQSIIQGLR